MTFQAYLDAVEEKTGLTPRQLIAAAHEKGLDAPGVKAGAILDWLKADYDLGRGHGMSIVHIIQNGDVHRDPREAIWLDGKATKPAS
jgi:hypothetical protein